jgi:hypothetical protein
LANPLFSIASATISALFGIFSDTMGLSDFPFSFIIGLRPWTFQHGLYYPPNPAKPEPNRTIFVVHTIPAIWQDEAINDLRWQPL